MRIRIALGAAMAALVLPAIFFAAFSSTSAASPRLIRHEASSQQPSVGVDDRLMSYSQAVTVAKFVDFSDAVELHEYFDAVELQEEKSYLAEVAFLKALAAQQAAARAAAQAAASAVAQARVAATPPSTPAPVATPAPAPAPTSGVTDATSANTADWACIRQHESGDNYAEGNGGAYQFELATWNALTGLPAPAQDYAPAVQDAAALKLYAQRGWQPWTTRYVCGL